MAAACPASSMPPVRRARPSARHIKRASRGNFALPQPERRAVLRMQTCGEGVSRVVQGQAKAQRLRHSELRSGPWGHAAGAAAHSFMACSVHSASCRRPSSP